MNIDIDPIIFQIGSLQPIGWHGVMMITGIIVAILLGGRVASKVGIEPNAVYTSALWIVLFGLIGARLTHVIDEFDHYSHHLGQIFAIWEGGLGWYGGLIGGTVGGVVYAKFARILALAVFLGLAIGRLGCTINGDAYGTPTSLPWGLIYTHPDAYADFFVKGHPAPIYEIIWIFGFSIALWALSGKKIPSIWLGVLGAAFVIVLNLIISDGLWTQFWVTMLGIAVVAALSIIIYIVLSKLRGWLSPPGSLFCATVAMYAFGRFLVSWVRDEPSVLGPLHQAHIISIILFVGSLAFLACLKMNSKNKGTSEALSNSAVKIAE
jgi:phosphatidylglycerol:prolipoprotein diacylglycerol transferase